MTKRKSKAIEGEYIDASAALAVVQPGGFSLDTLAPTFSLWAEHSTGQGERHGEIVASKARIVSAFFEAAHKQPQDVTPDDVAGWRVELARQGQAASTIYGKISRLSAYFRWLTDGRFNPCTHARPAAPKPYTSEKTKAMTRDETARLVDIVRTAAGASLPGKRDYAMLVLYLLTGMRRAEVLRLRWGDVKLGREAMTIRYTIKGGKARNRELRNREAVRAIRDYLKTDGRLDSMTDDSPLWLAHDFNRDGHSTARGTVAVSRHADQPITSHGFAKSMKRYADKAGVKGFHLHMTRHTVASTADSMEAAQDLLDHASQATTRIYRNAITTKRDKYSAGLADAFGIAGPDDAGQDAPVVEQRAFA